MRSFYFVWVISMLQFGVLCAQSELPALNLKFGKPTDAEMRMTEYPLDTVADAVILMRTCDVTYDMESIYNLSITYNYKMRIKVLKEEGKRFGDILIPFMSYRDATDKNYNEFLSDISGIAYNLNEKGKPVATRVNENMIFYERLDDYHKVCKFSIPQVKEGTVIEVKYSIYGPNYASIKDYVLQEEIPIIYTSLNMEIPAVLQFNVAVPTLNPRVTSSVKSGSIPIQNNTVEKRMATNCYSIVAKNMPAIKSDDFVWCERDYVAKVQADLKSTHFPNASYQARRTTWEEIDDLILRQEEIGPRLNDKSKFAAEIEAAGIAQLATPEEKVQAAIRLLHTQVAWNGDYDIIPDRASSVLKKHSGSSADLNMMLINMLNDLGLQSSPVYISTRRHGILPIHPSAKAFNTMIVAVDTPKGLLYADAVRIYAPVNTLIPNYYVQQARLVSKHRKCEFVDLTGLAQSRTMYIIQTSLSADGTLSGTISSNYQGNVALEKRNEYNQAEDSAAYVKAFASKHNLQVRTMELKGQDDNSQKMTGKVTFEKSVEVTEDLIYLNPFVMLPMGESPFKSEDRELPIELPYRENQTWSIDVKLPEGYTVEEMPKNFEVTTPDRKISAKFVCMKQDGHIRVNFNFVVKDIQFDANKYIGIKQAYDVISQRVNDIIVLKKKP